MSSLEHTVLEIDSDGIRIDLYISDYLGLFSRSQVKARVEKVTLNAKEVKISKKVHTGDTLSISYSDVQPISLEPEKMELTVLFENEHILVIDKPQGLVVHPGNGNWSGTLLNGVLWHCKELQKNFPDPSVRPGIVHRLDKETSGVIIVAKNPLAHEFVSNQFRKRRVKKKYIAIVKGMPPEQEGIIETFIERDSHNRKRFTTTKSRGKMATTYYKLIRGFAGYSLILLLPKTGRTHQLRVHMKSINCPILGDELYGRKDQNFPHTRLLLHAASIVFRVPFEKKKTKFKTEVPKRFKTALKEIRMLSQSAH
jgi:23S rRNA pseudouridine1911/1915/1917 synthase